MSTNTKTSIIFTADFEEPCPFSTSQQSFPFQFLQPSILIHSIDPSYTWSSTSTMMSVLSFYRIHLYESTSQILSNINFLFFFTFHLHHLPRREGIRKILWNTRYRNTDTIAEPPVSCGQQSSVAFGEYNTRQNIDKGHKHKHLVGA